MTSNIVVPELGESVVEARVARWLKKEGDRVEAGEPLVELETEKIDLEVSAERAACSPSIKRRKATTSRSARCSADRRRSRGGRVRACSRSAAPAAAPQAPRGGSGRGGRRQRQRVGRVRRRRQRTRDANRAQASPRRTTSTLDRRGRQRRGRTRHQAATSQGRIGGPPHAPQPQPHRQRPPLRRPPRRSPRPHRWRLVRSRPASAPRSACACRSAARRSRGGSSRRSTPPRC